MIKDMQNSPDQVYTVTAVNRMARYTLEESFPSIWVEGEISNYHHHRSGHRYFTLKDDESQLRCAMWRSSGMGLKFEPKDGLKVVARGNLTVYERGGQYQLIVNRLVPSGMGELELAFRQLKEKLEKEGLFDPAHKRLLPPYPMKIGVVTSATGAVIHDIIRVVRRRNPKIDIILWPTEVQGDIAPPQLAEGVRRLNEYAGVDLIIIGRGGGSLEDLWAFNDERVVRAVYESEIPVVSAVGHEVDITLTDLAADFSAATPSMAAEIVAWPLEDFQAAIYGFLRDIHRAAKDMISEGRSRFSDLTRARVFVRPQTMLESRYQFLDNQARLLHLLSDRRFDTFRKALALHLSRLEALSPLRVLARGYSVARSLPDKKVIRSVGDVAPGDRMETIVGDGSLFAVVDETKKADDDDGQKGV
jgi:exodeoxyribonuclease VII large subunit